MNKSSPPLFYVAAARLLAIGFALLVSPAFVDADEPTKADPTGAAMTKTDPTYGQQREFLSHYTQVLELSDGRGARVAICPQWQGRVMTSTCGDLAGPSFGWVNRDFITAGKMSSAFNNYGGEDRFWLAPEGGPFALWFATGSEQTLPNWFTPKDMNEGAFQVVSREREPKYRMTRRMSLTNYAQTKFDLEVTREIRLLSQAEFAASLVGQKIAGHDPAPTLDTKGLRTVGFSSSNTITNRGPSMQRDSGLVSIWILGQFPGGDQTVIIVPYRQGDEKELGPVVKSDYFGQVPPERLKVTPAAILFRGDGKSRTKIGTSGKRAMPIAGSIDFRTGVLTLVYFTMPADPAAALYLNNTWTAKQAEPYAGDAFNSYNDGSSESGPKTVSSFYELETLAPAVELARDKSTTHEHRTFHFQGEIAALAPLAKAALGVDLEEVRKMISH